MAENIFDRISVSLQRYSHRNLFSGVHFYFAPTLDIKTRSVLSEVLTSLGAEEAVDEEDPEGFDRERITHYFTDVMEKGEMDRLERVLRQAREDTKDEEGPKPVLPHWITRSYDLEALQDRRHYSPSSSAIFAGVCVCTSELPPGDSEAIKAGVQALGGWWKDELTREVTHLICLSPTSKKYERVMTSGQEYGMKAVLPHWIDDCLVTRTLLPTTNYEHPDPPILHPSNSLPKARHDLFRTDPSKPTTSKSGVKILTSTYALEKHLYDLRALQVRTGKWQEDVENLMPAPLREDSKGSRVGNVATVGVTKSLAENLPSSSRHNSTTRNEVGTIKPPTPSTGNEVLRGMNVYIASTVNVREGLLGAVKTYAEGCGARSVFLAALENDLKEQKEALENSDVVVCWRREGWEFWTAFEYETKGGKGKVVGNLTWLYELIVTGVWRSPREGLLLFPIPSGGIKRFREYVMTITNYTTVCRDYVRRLIEACGARFEGQMTRQSTTHVIACAKSGNKIQHAAEWGKPIINHLWLQECFLAWDDVHLANEAFVDLNETLNDLEVMERKMLTAESLKKWKEREEVREEKNRSLKLFELQLNGHGEEIKRVDVDSLEPVKESVRKGKVYESAMKKRRRKNLEKESGNENDENEREDTPIEKKRVRAEKKQRAEEQNRMDIDKVPSKGNEKDIEMKVVDSMAKQRQKRKPDDQTVKASITLTEPDKGDITEATKRKAKENEGNEDVSKKRRRTKDMDTEEETSKIEPKKKRKATEDGEPAKQKGPRKSKDRGEEESKAKQATKKRKTLDLEDEDLHLSKTKSTKKSRSSNEADQPPSKSEVISKKKSVEEEVEEEEEPPTESKKLSKGKVKASKRTADEEEKSERVQLRKSRSPEQLMTEGEDSENPIPKKTKKKMEIEEEEYLRLKKGEKGASGRLEQLKMAENKHKKSQGYSSFDDPPGKPRESVKVKVSHVSAAGKPIKVCTTGVTLDDDQLKALKDMKVKIVTDASQATHLVAGGIARTEKFLCALCVGRVYIVTQRWIKDSIKSRALLEEDAYILSDLEGEKKFKINLQKSLQTAKLGGLFSGKTVYITKQVQPDPAILKNIIKAAGGTYKTDTPSQRIVQKLVDGIAYLVSCEDDKALWDHLQEKNQFPVYNSEFILMGALKQELQQIQDFMLTPAEQ